MKSGRLLVIDDEPAICDFVKEVAEESGFEVVIAANFDQFGAAYGSFEPSVIVLDLRMPEVDGIELLRFLAEEKCRAHILLMSGLDQKVLHTTSLSVGDLEWSLLGWSFIQRPGRGRGVDKQLSQGPALSTVGQRQ